jgi:UDP-glucose 4-epimerase
MKFLITGGAGFIGSNLADRLLALGNEVVAYDNFSTGRIEFLEQAQASDRFQLIRGDTLDQAALTAALRGVDFVFHLAANADVRFGTEHPRKDLEQNTIATFTVLEAMRAAGVRRIAFSSTGSVYGEAEIFPTPEIAPFPVQTSLYGASKVAGEALISAYAEGFDFQGFIFRFVSILGPRYSHGHVFDFYRMLRDDPSRLTVLGNGKQRKSYLHVHDVADAMLAAIEHAPGKLNIFNLGTAEYCQVLDSIGWITDRLGIAPAIELTGGERGWIGDSPFIFLDTGKIRSLGWAPRYSIREGVIDTLSWLMANPWILEKRE